MEKLTKNKPFYWLRSVFLLLQVSNSRVTQAANAYNASADAEEAYVLRDAPAGQTLSQIAAQQKQAAQITAENQKEK